MSLPAKTAVPAQRSSWNILKIRRRIFLFLVIGSILLSIVAFLISSAASSKTVSIPDPPQEVNSTTALATDALLDYLSGRSTSVSVSKDVPARLSGEEYTKPLAVPYISMIGSTETTIGGGGNPSAPKEPGTFTTVKFLVGMQTKKLEPDSGKYILTVTYYVASVVMFMPDSGGAATVAAIPTLTPATFSPTDTLPSSDYSTFFPEVLTVAPDSIMGKAVEDWAKAFAAAPTTPEEGTEDLSRELLGVTGDTDTTHFYPGLGQWTADVETLVIGPAAPAPPVDPASPYAASWPAGYIVPVTFQAVPPGSKSSNKLTLSYSVWVAGDNTTADPPVVAWAPSASIDLMSPYMNARVQQTSEGTATQ